MSLERLTRQALALILLTASLQFALTARGSDRSADFPDRPARPQRATRLSARTAAATATATATATTTTTTTTTTVRS